MEFNKDLSIDKMDIYTDGKNIPEELFIGIEGTNFKSKGILNDFTMILKLLVIILKIRLHLKD